ncbi:MAG: YerC/YecD family TrpR-related protein [Elusimicrobiota bacterium]
MEPPQEKKLYEALLSLRDASACERFLADLCTPGEIHAMAERWLVAKLVDKGIPYRKIHEKTGVSTATITRVARALVHGRAGYRLVLDRMKEKRI